MTVCRILLLVSALGVSAGGKRAVAQSTQSARAEHAQVYAAVLAGAEGGFAAPVYVEAGIARYVARLPPRLRSDSILQDLSNRLDAASRVPGKARQLGLPDVVRIVSARESRRLQARGLGGTVVIAVSPVVFSADQRRAMLYLERHCGPVCGDSRVVWLSRDATGRWIEEGSAQLSSR